jgi:cellulose synthase/poly-beta-1,6-N-acetylglucosamine synthase-like glycosyltransferase
MGTILWLIAVILVLITLVGTLELFALTVPTIFRTNHKQKNDLENNIPSKKLAIVIPAHNEELNIINTINSIKNCPSDNHKISIIVVADNSSDDTANQAFLAGARVLIRKDKDKIGKGYALKYAFERLDKDTDAVIIVDADSYISKNLIIEYAKIFHQGAKAIQCRYLVKNSSSSKRNQLMQIAFYAFNVLRPLSRNYLGFSSGILGNGFALSYDLLQKVPYTSHSIVEDLEYHLEIIEAGYKVDFAQNVTVEADMPLLAKGIKNQRLRWEGGRLRMFREHSLPLLKRVLLGQYRFIEPLADLMLLPLAYHCLFLSLGLIIPVLWVQIYSLTALIIVVSHILTAMYINKSKWKDLIILLNAPLYMIWKLSLITKLIQTSRPQARWIRTER